MLQVRDAHRSVAFLFLRSAATTVALAMCCTISGCNIVGPVAAIITPPPKTEARYLLQDVPTVVFVDDRDNLVSPTSLRRVIADTASSQLMANEAVSMTISPQDAMLIASRSDRNNALMDIESIGRAVGAHQIIYVRITKFAATEDGYTPVPVATAAVKVVDVVNSTRVFPTSETPEGYPVKCTGKPVDPSLYSSRTTRMKVYESLSTDLGDEIAKLFYTHDAQELGRNLR